MRKFRFREFQIYKDSRNYRNVLKNVSKKTFTDDEKYCLTSQLWRALDSILLNIAEGSDRGTDKDFAHFLNNSHTSLNEVVSCLDLALDDGYIIPEDHQVYLEKAEKLANQLTAFRKSLLNSPNK